MQLKKEEEEAFVWPEGIELTLDSIDYKLSKERDGSYRVFSPEVKIVILFRSKPKLLNHKKKGIGCLNQTHRNGDFFSPISAEISITRKWP